MKAKTVALFAIAAILALGAPILGSKILNFMAQREWAAAEAEARAVGLPLTVEEALKDYQPGANARNAAEGAKVVLRTIVNPPKAESTNEFLSGFKPEFKKESDGMSKTVADMFKHGTKPDWGRLRRATAVFKTPLEELEQEVQKPDWNFKRPWKQGAAMLLPDGAHLKQLCRMLGIKARVAWYNRDFSTALASIQAMTRLGRHLQTEPILIMILVGVSCETLAYQAALDLPRIRPLAPAQIKALSTLTISDSFNIDWRRIWRTESASSLALMASFLSKQGLYDLGIKESDGYTVFSERKYLVAKSKVVRLLSQAEREWQGKPSDTETARQMAQKYANPIADTLNQYSDVFLMLSDRGAADSPIVNTIFSLKTHQARRRLTYLALQIAAQPKGKWTLPPAANNPAWLDPFSGKPMLLKTDAEGFRLYSLGANGTNDGGLDKDANDEPLDIVVSFPNR